MKPLFRTKADWRNEAEARAAQVSHMREALTHLAFYPPSSQEDVGRIATRGLEKANSAFRRIVTDQQ